MQICSFTSSPIDIALGSRSALTLSVQDAVSSLGAYGLRGAACLTEVSCGASSRVTETGDFAFMGCSSLTGAYLDGLTALGTQSFDGCRALERVRIGGISALPYRCFAGCSSLTGGDWSGVRTAADYVFKQSGLVSGDFPSLTSIGIGTFRDCAALTCVSLTAQDQARLLDSYAFDGANPSYTVRVKDQAYRQYYWQDATWRSVIQHVSSVTQPELTFTLDGAVLKRQVLNYDMDGDPPAVSKRGYQLTGWSPSYLSVRSDTNSAAQLSAITYRITYELDSGSHPESDPATYTVESPLITFGTPTKTGYKNGAFTPDSISTGSVGDITAVASYDPISYYVSFDGNGSTSGSKSTLTCQYDQTYSGQLGNPYQKTGHSFVNWKGQDGKLRLSSDDIRNWTQDDETVFRLSAQWSENSYGVAAYSNNESYGSATVNGKPSATVKYTGTATFLATPSPGYKFTGWSNGLTSNPYSVSPVAQSISLTAMFQTENSYTVTAAAGTGGTATVNGKSSDEVPEGASAEWVATPDTGYYFTGWSNSLTSNPYEVTSVKSNTSLTAYFAGRKYTVTLDMQSGTGGSSSVTATYGSAMPSITAPSCTGYTFGGYYDETGGNGTQYYTSKSASARSWNKAYDARLYAQWTGVTYSLAYNGNGNTGGSTTSHSTTYPNTLTVKSNDFTRSYMVTYSGNGGTAGKSSDTATYEFSSWNTLSSGTGASYSAGASYSRTTAGTTTLYAQWTAGSVTLTSATRTGHSFNGWYSASSGGDRYGGENDKYTPSANISAYAQWTPNSLSIIYDRGAGNGGTQPSPTVYTYGNGYTTRANTFTRQYMLTCSPNYTDGTASVLTATYLSGNWKTASGITLTANYEYSLTSDPIQQVSGSTTVSATWSGGAVTLPDPKREGYTLSAWYDADSGGNKIGAGGVSYTPSANISAYARWNANRYTVTFDKNGGNPPSPASKQVTYGSTYGALATCSRTGYTLAGWYTLSSGGSWVLSSSLVTTADNHRLFAHWAGIPYQVKFNANGGTGTMNNQQFYYGVSQQLKKNTFTRTGMDFDGWATTATGTVVYRDGAEVSNLTTTAGTEVDFYAKWKDKTYTVTYYTNY